MFEFEGIVSVISIAKFINSTNDQLSSALEMLITYGPGG